MLAGSPFQVSLYSTDHPHKRHRKEGIVQGYSGYLFPLPFQLTFGKPGIFLSFKEFLYALNYLIFEVL